MMLGKCLLVLLVAAAPLGLPAQQGSIPKAADEQAIHALVAAFEDAWNRHDAHAFAAAFAEDADFRT
jgi:hypothetical protein